MKPKRSALMGLAVLVFFWTLIYPRPYQAVLLVNMGLVALALMLLAVRRGVYLPGDGVPLAALIILPGFGLAACVSTFVQLFSRLEMIALALTFSALLAVLIALLDKAQRTAVRLVAMLLLHAPLGYAAALYADTALAQPAPQTFQTVVRGKHRTNRQDFLTLGPWGPRAKDDTDLVSADVYYSVREGQPVTVRLYPGRLGVPWFSIAP